MPYVHVWCCYHLLTVVVMISAVWTHYALHYLASCTAYVLCSLAASAYLSDVELTPFDWWQSLEVNLHASVEVCGQNIAVDLPLQDCIFHHTAQSDGTPNVHKYYGW